MLSQTEALYQYKTLITLKNKFSPPNLRDFFGCAGYECLDYWTLGPVFLKGSPGSWSAVVATKRQHSKSLTYLLIFFNNKSLQMEPFCPHLKKKPFHFWVNTLGALLIAANNAGLRSRELLQALHQWNNWLCRRRWEDVSHKEKLDDTQWNLRWKGYLTSPAHNRCNLP